MQRGAIVLRRNSWTLIYWDIRYRNGQPKRIRVSKKLVKRSDEYPTKTSVRLLADDVLAPLNRKQVTPAASLPLAEYIESVYFPSIKSRLRPSTVHGYEKAIYEPHLRKRLGKLRLRLRDLNAARVQQLLDAIAETPRTRKHRDKIETVKVNRTTLMHIKNFLSGVVTYAIRTGALTGPNTIQGKKLIDIPGRPSKFSGVAYSLDDIDAMIERVTDEDASDVIALLALTGLRQGEARGLRWSDFNEDNMTLNIARSHWRGSEPGPTKTISSEGVIPVLPTLASLLRNRRSRISPSPMDADFIFSGPRSGLPLDFKNLINRKILPKLDGSAVKWSGLHGFRRGLGTNLFDLGVHPRDIAGILRHDVNTSMKHYIKPQDTRRPALEKLETRINERTAKQGIVDKSADRSIGPEVSHDGSRRKAGNA